MFDRLMKRCGTRASGEQTLLAGVCVLAGLVTALAIVAAVHCQRRICLRFETSFKEKNVKTFPQLAALCWQSSVSVLRN